MWQGHAQRPRGSDVSATSEEVLLILWNGAGAYNPLVGKGTVKKWTNTINCIHRILSDVICREWHGQRVSTDRGSWGQVKARSQDGRQSCKTEKMCNFHRVMRLRFSLAKDRVIDWERRKSLRTSVIFGLPEFPPSEWCLLNGTHFWMTPQIALAKYFLSISEKERNNFPKRNAHHWSPEFSQSPTSSYHHKAAGHLLLTHPTPFSCFPDAGRSDGCSSHPACGHTVAQKVLPSWSPPFLFDTEVDQWFLQQGTKVGCLVQGHRDQKKVLIPQYSFMLEWYLALRIRKHLLFSDTMNDGRVE